ncbi:MAG: succinate--CoA ligase subunit alpha [Anaerolineae bacterium]|nr:succinate--CoA ligase subunit alpha [Anaerolineae bacterium]
MAILADANTRILVQGITGREAATFTYESMQYGARIVAGVTPGKGGQFIHGIPVFDTVALALRTHPCDATIISVPARLVRDATFEALSNGLKLIVVVTERIPRRDVVAMLEQAASVGARIIGPNSLGLIAPGKTRLGMGGGSAETVRRAYRPGSVGVISRSGGMMTEISNLLTQSGIGQSTCISIGGDPIIGSTMLDLLPLYEADRETQALVLFCEPGGTMEERLAAHLKAHGSRLWIIAFVAGRFTDRNQGVRFGHAGAIVEGGRGSPASKAEALREAGILVAEKFSQITDLLREHIGSIV